MSFEIKPIALAYFWNEYALVLNRRWRTTYVCCTHCHMAAQCSNATSNHKQNECEKVESIFSCNFSWLIDDSSFASAISTGVCLCVRCNSDVTKSDRGQSKVDTEIRKVLFLSFWLSEEHNLICINYFVVWCWILATEIKTSANQYTSIRVVKWSFHNVAPLKSYETYRNRVYFAFFACHHYKCGIPVIHFPIADVW